MLIYILRTVATRHMSYQFTHIYSSNAWLPFFHRTLTLSEQWQLDMCYQFTHIYGSNAWLPLPHSMFTLSEQR